MVQGAVYDAVNSIDGGHQPYLAGLPPASPSASLEAAVATAAHHVLVGLGIAPVPALPQVVRDRLDGLYADALAGIPDGAAKTDGIAAGAAAAAAMLAARTDRRPVRRRSRSRSATSAGRVASDPAWHRQRPVRMGGQRRAVRAAEPVAVPDEGARSTLTSRAYAKEYNEVKELGADGGQPAHREQDAVARFYTVNPVEMFNRTFRVIAEDAA